MTSLHVAGPATVRMPGRRTSTELPARQSQLLGWTKHFTSYTCKPKTSDLMMYFLFLWGVGRVRGFMVLQNYFSYFELNQSLGLAKSKDPYGKNNNKKNKKNTHKKTTTKKQQHLITCTFHIYTRAIFPASSRPQTSHYDFEKPLNLSQKCWYSFSVIFRTTSLQVCCLPTQIFQAGSVGRKFFWLPVQVKDTILRLNCF